MNDGIIVPPEREDGMPVDSRTEEMIRALDMVRDILVDGGRLDARAQEVFNDVLRNHSNRIKAGLVAIAMQRFGQIGILTQQMDSIETEVRRRVDTEKIKAAGLKDLAILYRAFADREKVLIQFISTIADGGMPEKLEDTLDMRDLQEDLESKGITSIPRPESRERVVKMLKALVDKK